jgi:hypothetical protein
MDNVKTLTPLVAAAFLITSVAVLLTQIPQASAANDWIVFTIKTADDTSTIRGAEIFVNGTSKGLTDASGRAQRNKYRTGKLIKQHLR